MSLLSVKSQRQLSLIDGKFNLIGQIRLRMEKYIEYWRKDLDLKSACTRKDSNVKYHLHVAMSNVIIKSDVRRQLSIDIKLNLTGQIRLRMGD